ncbi:E3 ubiquitin-protein ligase ATL6-like [Panicum miliaceum]|uniref:E3 ubiquitin-protein ligase ATL6-like n=1 Tax=Panicum miliaceum TaxID=4540 RepID=A0A3L6RP57_PANMI|nr:E3 ubiquitin-protein ligase ATL6-like [Panicum miliaceum]
MEEIVTNGLPYLLYETEEEDIGGGREMSAELGGSASSGCHRPARASTAPPRVQHPPGARRGGRGGGRVRRGPVQEELDPAEVATSKVGKSVLKCAVCLMAFEDDDDLRLLPHCSHAFHLECIDPCL